LENVELLKRNKNAKSDTCKTKKTDLMYDSDIGTLTKIKGKEMKLQRCSFLHRMWKVTEKQISSEDIGQNMQIMNQENKI